MSFCPVLAFWALVPHVACRWSTQGTCTPTNSISELVAHICAGAPRKVGVALAHPRGYVHLTKPPGAFRACTLLALLAEVLPLPSAGMPLALPSAFTPVAASPEAFAPNLALCALL